MCQLTARDNLANAPDVKILATTVNDHFRP